MMIGQRDIYSLTPRSSNIHSPQLETTIKTTIRHETQLAIYSPSCGAHVKAGDEESH
jgi:hypothetical protein